MRLLLDTHVVLWWLADDAVLSDEVKTLIDQEPAVYVSPATVWEIAIKQSMGKITMPYDLAEHVAASEFRELPITFEHALAAARLPPIHRDPFDRVLVAQAQCAGLTLVTADPDIPRYEVDVLPA